MRRARGLVWIVADDIKEVPPEKEQTIAEAPAPQPLIPPEVRFSVPVDGETDVAAGVRASRAMTEAS